MNKKKLIFTVIFTLIVMVVTQGVFLFKKGKIPQSTVKQKSALSDSIIGEFIRQDDFTPDEDYVMLAGLNPNDGFIPDYKSAIKYAELIWRPIFGENIYKEKPFNAILQNDSIWVVYGTLPKNTIGGTIEAIFRKSDGKILRIVHQK